MTVVEAKYSLPTLISVFIPVVVPMLMVLLDPPGFVPIFTPPDPASNVNVEEELELPNVTVCTAAPVAMFVDLD
jgi:hypothetical protein